MSNRRLEFFIGVILLGIYLIHYLLIFIDSSGRPLIILTYLCYRGAYFLAQLFHITHQRLLTGLRLLTAFSLAK